MVFAIRLVVMAAIAFAMSALAGGVARAACQPGDARYAGHYYLNGVMEIGSELLLRADGSFEFGLAYGANDQYGKGCWVKQGNRISLVPAGRNHVSGRHTPDSRGFTGFVVTVDGRDLVWDIGGSGHVGRYARGR